MLSELLVFRDMFLSSFLCLSNLKSIHKARTPGFQSFMALGVKALGFQGSRDFRFFGISGNLFLMALGLWGSWGSSGLRGEVAGIFVFIYIYMYIYIYMCVCVCVTVCVCVYLYIYIYIYMAPHGSHNPSYKYTAIHLEMPFALFRSMY